MILGPVMLGRRVRRRVLHAIAASWYWILGACAACHGRPVLTLSAHAMHDGEWVPIRRVLECPVCEGSGRREHRLCRVPAWGVWISFRGAAGAWRDNPPDGCIYQQIGGKRGRRKVS